MKGGKGGQGRKRSSTRIVEKVKPRGGVKKGAPKRDWGPLAKDDVDVRAASHAPVRPPGNRIPFRSDD